ncbi:Hypothetical predicted protein, partial [Podarcis lilfordi]
FATRNAASAHYVRVLARPPTRTAHRMASGQERWKLPFMPEIVFFVVKIFHLLLLCQGLPIYHGHFKPLWRGKNKIKLSPVWLCVVWLVVFGWLLRESFLCIDLYAVGGFFLLSCWAVDFSYVSKALNTLKEGSLWRSNRRRVGWTINHRDTLSAFPTWVTHTAFPLVFTILAHLQTRETEHPYATSICSLFTVLVLGLTCYIILLSLAFKVQSVANVSLHNGLVFLKESDWVSVTLLLNLSAALGNIYCGILLNSSGHVHWEFVFWLHDICDIVHHRLQGPQNFPQTFPQTLPATAATTHPPDLMELCSGIHKM